MSKINEFIAALRLSLNEGSFIKLSLGNYKGADDLKKLHVKKIVVKREEKLSITYTYKTRDIVKNYDDQEAVDIIEQALKTDFYIGTLFTAQFDLMVERYGQKEALKKLDPTSKDVSTGHDREKRKLITAQGKSYLYDLKITDEKGEVYKNAQDKYRQINKYIEIVDTLIGKLPPKKELTIVDMGSGKGYLTFALYDHVCYALKIKTRMHGVEYRQDMVDLCNKIANNASFDGLKFMQGAIADYHEKNIDILIALHACDTATDDAIIKGIKADAELIVVAPCCHKQIRREIERSKTKNEIEFLTRHGIFLERQAEMATDGIRALILEYLGYTTKVFEFISGEHTAKNVMIVGIKNPRAKKHAPEILAKIKAAKEFYGIEKHYLEALI